MKNPDYMQKIRYLHALITFSHNDFWIVSSIHSRIHLLFFLSCRFALVTRQLRDATPAVIICGRVMLRF